MVIWICLETLISAKKEALCIIMADIMNLVTSTTVHKHRPFSFLWLRKSALPCTLVNIWKRPNPRYALLANFILQTSLDSSWSRAATGPSYRSWATWLLRLSIFGSGLIGPGRKCFLTCQRTSRPAVWHIQKFTKGFVSIVLSVTRWGITHFRNTSLLR